MEKRKVEVVFILDRSGSMAGLEKETISGFNEMLNKQKQLEQSAIVTTILFDNEYEVLHNRIPIHHVQNMTKEQYFVRGTTALFDAVGRSIETIKDKQMQEYQLADEKIIYKTLFVVITDGLENASAEYTLKKVQELIHHQQKNFQWEFIFLGAHIDSLKEAEQMGIKPEHFRKFEATQEGVRANFEMVKNAVYRFREKDTFTLDEKEDEEKTRKA